ncbi:hypothetical protein [Tenacibaculum phage Larrie]|nr:hypothetical protein [Tenacibaculum phage Larrie]
MKEQIIKLINEHIKYAKEEPHFNCPKERRYYTVSFSQKGFDEYMADQFTGKIELCALVDTNIPVKDMVWTGQSSLMEFRRIGIDAIRYFKREEVMRDFEMFKQGFIDDSIEITVNQFQKDLVKINYKAHED